MYNKNIKNKMGDGIVKNKILTLLSVLLIMCFAISFTACGGGNDSDGDANGGVEEKVTVSYELDGGTLPTDAPKSYIKGEAPDFSKVKPTRDGYVFDGWYIDAGFKTAFSENAVTGTSVKLYAKWSEAGYTISYELDGGTLPEGAPTKHIPGERTSLPFPTKEGFIFDGWYLDADFEEIIVSINKDVAEDVTVYVKWLESPEMISEIPDQSRGYFGSGYDTITLDLTKYVNSNGLELSYSAVSSNTDFATVSISGDMLSIELKSGEGSADITLDVSVGEEKYLMYEFTVTPKKYTKIACVGDSLTESTKYPDFLQEIVGADITVGNFGRSGASLSVFTNNDSYGAYNSEWNKEKYEAGIEFAKDAELVIIMLGTNDATKIEGGQPKFDWAEVKPAYKAAYEALINDYKTANPDIEIVMLTSPPVVDGNNLSISNDILEDNTYPLQLEIANELGIRLIDTRAYVKGLSGGYDDMFSDGVHFNEDGSRIFAEFVANNI